MATDLNTIYPAITWVLLQVDYFMSSLINLIIHDLLPSNDILVQGNSLTHIYFTYLRRVTV